ncbi:hypothetical protein KUCAC02_020703, partial [Chaenocephalus aceratus]
SSFASRRRTASQGLFKGSANPIRLLICEALSPRTPASVETTSRGITGLLVVIGGDRDLGRLLDLEQGVREISPVSTPTTMLSIPPIPKSIWWFMYMPIQPLPACIRAAPTPSTSSSTLTSVS